MGKEIAGVVLLETAMHCFRKDQSTQAAGSESHVPKDVLLAIFDRDITTNH